MKRLSILKITAYQVETLWGFIVRIFNLLLFSVIIEDQFDLLLQYFVVLKSIINEKRTNGPAKILNPA